MLIYYLLMNPLTTPGYNFNLKVSLLQLFCALNFKCMDLVLKASIFRFCQEDKNETMTRKPPKLQSTHLQAVLFGIE